MGRTRPIAGRPRDSTEHPHGRGEDVAVRQHDHVGVGTPPRAWGGPYLLSLTRSFVRNTPTGVGRTGGRGDTPGGESEHPHGRGEDHHGRADHVAVDGTPPRAWGGPWRRVHRPDSTRNTPTGVGRTRRGWSLTTTAAEHPHGRGEDVAVVALAATGSGTPPRAWGGRIYTSNLTPAERNTPTGVGRTLPDLHLYRWV